MGLRRGLSSCLAILLLSACPVWTGPAQPYEPPTQDETESTGSVSDSSGWSDSSSSTDSSGESSTESEAESGTFIWADHETPSCGEECDIWNPECPEGEKCTAVACEVGSNAWDSHVCREIQGTAQMGDECMYTDGSGVSGNDTCAEGNQCWNADADTGLGTCVAFCTGSPDAAQCPSGYNCHILGNGVGPRCFPMCNPLEQNCESSYDLCIPVSTDPDSGYQCAIDASQNMGTYGTPCRYANVCNHFLMCIDAERSPAPSCVGADGCCAPFCAISSGIPCPGVGEICDPVFETQPIGFEDVGVCRLPLP